jgi:two-component system phosphate regulon sensor histidine kinase PhoR
MMRRPFSLKIRWKLMATYLILVALVLLTTTLLLKNILGKYIYQTTLDQLKREALIVKNYLESELTIRDFSYSLDPIVDKLSKKLDVRITVVKKDGTVLADSDVSETALLAMEKHDSRPEIKEALTKQFGQSRRYSTTLKSEMLYIAYPLISGKNPIGVVRLAIRLKEIHLLHSKTNNILYLVSLIGFLIAILISLIVSSFIVKPIKEITNMAKDVARGSLSRRVFVTTGDEIQELAESINEMTYQLKDKIDQEIKERNSLNSILEGMVEGVMVTDSQGKLIMVNTALKRIFSLTQDTTGKTPIEVIRNSDLQTAFDRIQKGQESVKKEISLYGGEKEKTLIVQVVALKRNEELQGAIGVFHDISELKRLENIRKDFVANVSHELKTPLSAIIGYSETLLHKDFSKEKEREKSFLEIISNHAKRLANIVEDLLKISEIESGSHFVDINPIEMKDVLGRALKILENEIEKKKLSLTIESTIPEFKSDEYILEQVLLNLLDNAVKYTPENGEIRVKVAAKDSFIQVDVSDTGIGIPSRDLSRIFERFYTVDKARSREMGGTGLGLSIVKNLIESIGGKVSVTSEVNKGSTFTFTFPRYD